MSRHRSAGTTAARLADVLDYRAWHEFVAQVHEADGTGALCDADLASALRRHRIEIHEEHVLSELLDDIAARG